MTNTLGGSYMLYCITSFKSRDIVKLTCYLKQLEIGAQ